MAKQELIFATTHADTSRKLKASLQALSRSFHKSNHHYYNAHANSCQG